MRTPPPSRFARPLAGAAFVVAAALGAAGCGDFQLAEFTRATTTTVEVEESPTSVVDTTPSSVQFEILRARHVVEPGETINSIAMLHGVPAAAILEANGIGDANSIEAGRELIIPDPDAEITPPWQQREQGLSPGTS